MQSGLKSPGPAWLPPELWCYVFYWATYNGTRDEAATVDPAPFESINAYLVDADSERALRVKRTLALVCSRWRALSAKYLYEDIRVRHGSQALANALESPKDSSSLGYGHHVRRIILAVLMRGIRRGAVCRNARRIIACCPNVTILARSRKLFARDDERDFGHDAPSLDGLHLPRLLRVDWESGPIDATQSLPSTIWKSNTLQVLSLGGSNMPWMLNAYDQTSCVQLPNVHTLRVNSILKDGIPGLRLSAGELPSLRRIIIDGLPDTFYMISESFLPGYGPQVRTLELGIHKRFFRTDCVSVIIKHCPNLEELYYPVFVTKALSKNHSSRIGVVYPSVRLVGLHSTSQTQYCDTDDKAWCQILGHFRALCGEGSRYPSLRTIILHGREWSILIGDERFILVMKLVRSRGVKLLFEDGLVFDNRAL